jgi:hypothetical protein
MYNNGGTRTSWSRFLARSMLAPSRQRLADLPGPFDVRWDGPIIIAIDFGHHASGFSYTMNGGASVELCTDYPDQAVPYAKTPTCLLYDSNRRAVAWGCTAERVYKSLPRRQRGRRYALVKAFKLALHTEPGMQPQALEGAEWLDPLDATADYLRFMYQ